MYAWYTYKTPTHTHTGTQLHLYTPTPTHKPHTHVPVAACGVASLLFSGDKIVNEIFLAFASLYPLASLSPSLSLSLFSSTIHVLFLAVFASLSPLFASFWLCSRLFCYWSQPAATSTRLALSDLTWPFPTPPAPPVPAPTRLLLLLSNKRQAFVLPTDYHNCQLKESRVGKKQKRQLARFSLWFSSATLRMINMYKSS